MQASVLYTKADIRQGLLGLDPRTHLFVFVVVAISAALMTTVLEMAILQVLAALYLVACGKVKVAIRSCMSFIIAGVLSFLPLPGLWGALFINLMHVMQPFTIIMGLISLSPSAIMCAFDRWHVSLKVLIGLCVAFRFAILVAQEGRCIVQGIRMRGIFPHIYSGLFRPTLLYECVYTPLVMRCLRLTSELAASSELRGIEIRGQRSSIYHVGFSACDGLTLLVSVILCTALSLVGVFW